MSKADKLITLLNRYESDANTYSVTVKSSDIKEMINLAKEIKDEQTGSIN